MEQLSHDDGCLGSLVRALLPSQWRMVFPNPLLGQELLRECLALMRRGAMSLTASRVLLPLFMLTLAATPAAVIGGYAGHAIRARK
jgi:hypothetical protein